MGDEEQRRHYYDCSICQREGFWKNRICYVMNREEMVPVPIFEQNIIVGRRPKVLTEEGALLAASEVIGGHRSYSACPVLPTVFEAYADPDVGLGVCPASAGRDEAVISILDAAHLSKNGYPVSELSNGVAELVLKAVAVMNRYESERIKKLTKDR